jgi:glutaredoxin
MAKVKLHRCSFLWFKGNLHPCARVQKALDDQGIEYTIVKEPAMRGKRDWVAGATGQRLLPVIEFEDGSIYRERSKDMAARIRAGKLFEGRGAAS